MEDTDRLTERQWRYVQRVASGMASIPAATAAGYSPSFTKVSASRLLKKPSVAKALDRVRTEGRTLAAYDLARAMAEAQEVIVFAKQHKNAMAYCKAVELRARLSGLLVERVEVFTADLKGALALAQSRVIEVSPAVQQLTQAAE